MLFLTIFSLIGASCAELVPLYRYEGASGVHLSTASDFSNVPENYRGGRTLLGSIEDTETLDTLSIYEWLDESYYYTSRCQSDVLIDYRYKGEIGYCYQTLDPNNELLPLYRLYSSADNMYNYVTSDVERDMLLSNGYVIEAIICLILKTTISPTTVPSAEPSDNPTNNPTEVPSVDPTNNPSGSPTNLPSINPSDNPTINPSAQPSNNPTSNPTIHPTDNPTPYSEYHVTGINFASTSQIQECHSTISKFKKGVRCCYEDVNNQVQCTSTDGNNNCYTDFNNISPYSFTYSWTEANDICQQDNKRLCTIDEYENYCYGTGCLVDYTEAWTSTPCNPFIQTHIYGNGETKKRLPSTLGAIRCCTLTEDGTSNSKCVSKIDGSNDPPAEGESPLCFWAHEGLTVDTQIAFTHTQATEICESYGYRLCDLDVLKPNYDVLADTKDQILSQCAISTITTSSCQQFGCGNTGCSVNSRPAWVRTSYNFTV